MTPVGRHAKPEPDGRRWPWPIALVLELGREHVWGIDGDLDIAELEKDERRQSWPLGAWWDDWAQPHIGRALFVSAGVIGVVVGFVTVDTLPTWVRLCAPLVVLALLATSWSRKLRQWLKADRPPVM